MVTDGGSAAGRSGVCQGTLDIGMSDVPLTSQEMSSLNCGDAVQTAVAMEAFVVVANPNGPYHLEALSREQMQNIFSGAVHNWLEVDGADQPLVVINRLKGSGTRQNMADYLFGGDDSVFGASASDEDNSQRVVDAVTQTPGAISYLGLAYVSNPALVTFGIKQPDGTVVAPTKDVVAGLRWPIGGPGLVITKGQPNALATAFINYLLSATFQADPAWENLGFVVPANPAIGNAFGQ